MPVHFLFLDESGGVERPDFRADTTPLMVILGVIVDARRVPMLTREFLSLKRLHFPRLFDRGPALNHVLTEVKGGDILQLTRSKSRNRRRQAALIRHAVLDLVDRFGCRIVGRVWVKAAGAGLSPASTYCYAVQDIALHFSEFLRRERSRGVFIADSRDPKLNVSVAHSIFTQKWRTSGDPYPSLMEVPLFAQSNNHVGLQLADLLASTLVFPMACATYGAPMGNVHASPRYEALRADHGGALRDLQFRYKDGAGHWRGGLVVSDPAGKRPGSLLFQK